MTKYTKDKIPGFYSGLKDRLEQKDFIVYYNISMRGVPYLRIGRTKDDLYSIQYFKSTRSFKVFDKDRQSSLFIWNAVILDENGKKVQAKINDFIALIEKKIK